MFRIALLSRWHVHAQSPDNRYAKEFLSQPDCNVVCVWDSDEATAKEWGAEYNVPYYTNLHDLLSRDDIDGVLVTSNAHEHKEILIAAANAKKHIFTEKVLAYSLEDALEIQNAVKENGIKFCISFNRLGIKQLIYAKTLLENGTLGEPLHFRCLCAHDQGYKDTLPSYWYDPAITCGGALIDMGFNSTYLARYIMGDFESVTTVFNDNCIHKEVEDTAICTVKFKNGATGTIEGSFCTPAMSVFELALYGTKGAYYTRFGSHNFAEIHIAGQPNQQIPLDDIPEILESPIKTWIKACTLGASDEVYGIDAAVEMVKFMVAAYNSAKEDSKRVTI